MGYKVSYGPKIHEKKRKPAPLPIAVACVLVLALGARVLLPEAASRAKQLLLPGDAGTRQAFEQMLENVRAGESLEEALTVFCQEIIDNAELADVS